jgi:signal transduction histidine kinase/DNA-binding response OmpR family regulator
MASQFERFLGETMINPNQILVVDDDLEMQNLLRICLAPPEYDVTVTGNGRQALEMLETGQFGVAILDLMLPDLDGIKILRRIREQRPEIEIIVLTAYASLETAIEALRLGAYDYVTKPFDVDTLRSAVRRAVEKQNLALERERAEEALQQRNRELALLSRTGQVFNSTLDLEQVLVTILEEVRSLLNVATSSIWLIDPEVDELICLQGTGPRWEIVRDWRLAMGEGLVGWVACSGESLIVPDAQADERHFKKVDQQTGLTLHSFLNVPLRIKQNVIGVLQVADAQVDRFKPTDLRLVESLASAATIAIENARLYEQAQQEIAEREQAEDALRQAKDAAEAASRAKSEFLARMSHEIRTPIHSIMGMTDLMLDTMLTPGQDEYLSILKSSTDSLMAVVNDILDFSKIEAGRLELEEINFDLRNLIEQVVEMLALRTQRRGLELVYHIPPQVPTALVGDPRRLRQVLLNLTDNAVKFTPQGKIVIQVETQAEQEEEVELGFAVCDTGIGISEDKRDVIFEPFQQADGSTTREYGGTGLGLTISRQLVELMGGRIWVESHPGEGSTFHFTLRLKKQAGDRRAAVGSAAMANWQELPAQETETEPERAIPAATTERAGLHVLLAEDNLAAQLVGKKTLEKAGYTVQVADDGLGVLWMLEEREFDLVLMDVEMPQMDGLEATRAIREREAGSSQHIPILAVTAYAAKEDQERCLEAGVDGYLSKPVSPEKLHTAIEHFLSPDRAGDAAPPVDLAVALEATNGDKELLLEAVKLFLERDYPRHLEGLRAGLARRDARAIKRAAHGIKGVVDSFGGRAACDAALRLETIGRKGDLDGAQSAMAALETEIERFAAFFAPIEWE